MMTDIPECIINDLKFLFLKAHFRFKLMARLWTSVAYSHQIKVIIGRLVHISKYISECVKSAPVWLFDAGEQWLYGCWFYRPGETFHLATRKFLEKEVFKSDYYNKVPFSKILGKCMVLFVKVNGWKHSLFFP